MESRLSKEQSYAGALAQGLELFTLLVVYFA